MLQVEGFVLHTRKFTDSKLLVTIFAESLGRVTGVARMSKKQPSPRPFVKHFFVVSGAGAVKTIRSLEPVSGIHLEQGRRLFCGIYLNELLMRALPEAQAHDELVEFYSESLSKLSLAVDEKLQEVLLRRFEFRLLKEMGMGLNFRQCSQQNQIKSDATLYEFLPESGFMALKNSEVKLPSLVFSGMDLQCIGRGEWTESSLRSAKKIARMALKSVIGDKPIKARELFT